MNFRPNIFALFANSVIAENQFRSKVSGRWDEVSFWERQVGDRWIAASAYPGTGANVIIQTNYKITIPAGVSPSFSNVTINKNGVSENPVENQGSLELNILDGGVVNATKNKK